MYYTYSGKLAKHAAPSVENVAISLMRESRYTGNGKDWWCVGLHSFVVADLLPNHLKLHGLLHDQPECITGDIPKDLKTKSQRKLEDLLLAQFYNANNIKLPTPEEHIEIKAADLLAVHGEVYAGAGTDALREKYGESLQAEALVLGYLNEYSFADCLKVNGRAVKEFQRRFAVYQLFLHKYVCSGTPVLI